MTLKVTKKFRYFFQGIRGSSSSSGAILIDDISLSETECPNAVWQIRNFTNVLATTPAGTPIKSQCFYNSEGYSFGISVYPNGRDSDYPDYVGMAMHLCSGENDAVMEWPAANRQVTIVAMDQNPDIKLRMSNTRSFTTGGPRSLEKREFTIAAVSLAFSRSMQVVLVLLAHVLCFTSIGDLWCVFCLLFPPSDNHSRWNKPTASSGAVFDPSCQCYRGPDFGWSTFMSHRHLHIKHFLKHLHLIITAHLKGEGWKNQLVYLDGSHVTIS